MAMSSQRSTSTCWQRKFSNLVSLKTFNFETHLQDDDAFGILRGQLGQLGRDHLAGSAPGGEEVQHHQLTGSLGQLGLEVILQRENVNC